MPETIEVSVDRDEILAHLDRVLADRRFATAERIARFLRHEVKESVVATEV